VCLSIIATSHQQNLTCEKGEELLQVERWLSSLGALNIGLQKFGLQRFGLQNILKKNFQNTVLYPKSEKKSNNNY
jgi:hypothetical protein